MEVKLCGGASCCPIVRFDKEDKTKDITITDDNGGKVTLTREEWDILVTGIKDGVYE